MSTTITPTEQNIEINVNNDVIDINVTNEIVDVNATTQQIDINVAGAYPLPSSVTSVFGRVGDVVATEGDYTLTQLGDVTLTSPSNGQVLKYNGTNWVNGTDAGGLTSVGLSMPSAFTVSNSPLTSNGTIGVTGAGTTAQYVRGDGTLATFPSIITQAQNLVTEVYNRTGATLTKGTIVYINGGQGNLPTVTKAIATGDSTSAQTYGIVQADITNMNNGYVVVAGRLSDIDTQAYTEGTQLYLSSTTAGTYTSTKQYAPAHLVYIGIIVRSHPTQGIIEVKIQNGYELDEIHNVAAQTPTNNDGLFWEASTSLWKNKSISTILGGSPVLGSGTINTIPKFTTSDAIGNSNLFDSGTTIYNINPSNGQFAWQFNASTTSGQSYGVNILAGTTSADIALRILNAAGSSEYLKVTGDGRLQLGVIPNATTDTDRFLVSDGGVIKYRTGTELLSDIGGQSVITNPITGTGTSGQVAYFNGTTSITSDATFTYTPTSQLLVNNSVTAASQLARGTNFNSTLIATANNDVLVGLDINSTFTNGAFTSVRQYAARFNRDISVGTKGQWTTYTLSNNIYLGNSYISASNQASGGDLYIAANYYYNGTIATNIGSGYSTLIGLNPNNDGRTLFYTSGNNAAGASVALTTTGTIFQTGNWLLGTGTTDSGFRLDVNGTARVQDNLIVSNNRNAATRITVSNTTSGTSSISEFTAISNNGDISFGKFSPLKTAVKIINGNDAYVVNSSNSGDIAILNDFATGSIKMAAGGSSTAQLTIASNGTLTSVANATASGAIARGVNITPTLVAAANNDVLVGLDINPTFTNGAFTGVTNLGLRVNGLSQITGNGNDALNIVSGGLKITRATISFIDIINSDAGKTTFRLAADSSSFTDAFTIKKGTNFPFVLFASTNNFALGYSGAPTDAGFRLDVNGTARVQGVFNIVAQSNDTNWISLQRIAGNLELFNIKMTSGVNQNLSINTSNRSNALFIDRVANIASFNTTVISDNGGSATTGLLVASTISSTTSMPINAYDNTAAATGVGGGIDFWGNNGSLQSAGSRIKTLKENSGTRKFSLAFYTNTDGGNASYADLVEQMRIFSNGNILIQNGGTFTDVASSILTINSTTKGFLPPRMTTTQKNAISSPATGLVVFDTTLGKLCVFSTTWQTITSV